MKSFLALMIFLKLMDFRRCILDSNFSTYPPTKSPAFTVHDRLFQPIANTTTNCTSSTRYQCTYCLISNHEFCYGCPPRSYLKSNTCIGCAEFCQVCDQFRCAKCDDGYTYSDFKCLAAKKYEVAKWVTISAVSVSIICFLITIVSICVLLSRSKEKAKISNPFSQKNRGGIQQYPGYFKAPEGFFDELDKSVYEDDFNEVTFGAYTTPGQRSQNSSRREERL